MTEPVSLEEMKDHLRLDQGDTGEDIYLQSLTTAARRACEHAINRTIVGRGETLSLDAFPAPAWGFVARRADARSILLPGGEVEAVNAVTYRSSAGATVTIAPETYVVDLVRIPARIEPIDIWPMSSSQVRIAYTIAPLGEDDMALARQAIKLLVGQWYVNRESAVTGITAAEVPRSVGWLLQLIRQFSSD